MGPKKSRSSESEEDSSVGGLDRFRLVGVIGEDAEVVLSLEMLARKMTAAFSSSLESFPCFSTVIVNHMEWINR